ARADTSTRALHDALPISHAHGEEGMRRAVEAGVTSIEHGTYMSDEVMSLMKQRGTWYIPTIHAGRFVAEKAEIDGYFPEVVRPKDRKSTRLNSSHVKISY